MIEGLFALLGIRKSSAATMRVAQELAVASLPIVRSEVQRGSLPQSRAEARGYVAAKCRPIVARHVEQYVRTTPAFDAQLAETLRGEVTHRIVRLMLDEMLRSRKVAVEHRRAA